MTEVRGGLVEALVASTLDTGAVGGFAEALVSSVPRVTQPYRYTDANFPNGRVDAERFSEEIAADGSISETLEAIDVDRDVERPETRFRVSVFFENDLTEDEVAALDDVVAEHSGEPVAELEMWSIVPEMCKVRDFRGINYKTGLLSRMHKVLTVVFRGEVREVRYYLDPEDLEGSLALVVSVSYVRSPIGIAMYRTTTRTWYRTDGTPHPDPKTTTKIYDQIHAMLEGTRRRTNVVNALTLDVLAMLVATTAVDPTNPTPEEIAAAEATGMLYISKYEAAMTNFVRVGDLSFRGTDPDPPTPNVATDSEDWLDNDVTPYGWTGPTIRDEILGHLKYIYEPE